MTSRPGFLSSYFEIFPRWKLWLLYLCLQLVYLHEEGSQRVPSTPWGPVLFLYLQNTHLVLCTEKAPDTQLLIGIERTEKIKMSRLNGRLIAQESVNCMTEAGFFYFFSELLAAFTFPGGSGTGQQTTQSRR